MDGWTDGPTGVSELRRFSNSSVWSWSWVGWLSPVGVGVGPS